MKQIIVKCDQCGFTAKYTKIITEHDLNDETFTDYVICKHCDIPNFIKIKERK